jgi:hypothetical protein
MDAYDDGRRKRRPRQVPVKTPGLTPSLFDGQPQARVNDPVTSHDAAKKADRGTSRLQDCLMILFRTKVVGLTDDELIELYRVRSQPCDSDTWPVKSPQRIRSARADLVKAGKLKDSGQKRTSALGNPSVVWELV